MVDAWDRQKGESAKAYERFKIYLYLPPGQRSLKKVHEKLGKLSVNSTQNSKIPTLRTLENNSADWKWVDRVRLYDAHEQLKEIQKYEEDFTKNNKKLINLLKDLLDYCDTSLKEIMDNNAEYALTTRLSLISTLMGVIDRANYNIRTCFGKPAKYTDKLEVDLDNQVSMKEGEVNIFKKSDKELEELLSVNDDFDMEAFLEEQKQ